MPFSEIRYIFDFLRKKERPITGKLETAVKCKHNLEQYSNISMIIDFLLSQQMHQEQNKSHQTHTLHHSGYNDPLLLLAIQSFCSR